MAFVHTFHVALLIFPQIHLSRLPRCCFLMCLILDKFSLWSHLFIISILRSTGFSRLSWPHLTPFNKTLAHFHIYHLQHNLSLLSDLGIVLSAQAYDILILQRSLARSNPNWSTDPCVLSISKGYVNCQTIPPPPSISFKKEIGGTPTHVLLSGFLFDFFLVGPPLEHDGTASHCAPVSFALPHSR